MTADTKRKIRRDFMPRGALRRGLVWIVVCLMVAYLPGVAQAISHA